MRDGLSKRSLIQANDRVSIDHLIHPDENSRDPSVQQTFNSKYRPYQSRLENALLSTSGISKLSGLFVAKTQIDDQNHAY